MPDQYREPTDEQGAETSSAPATSNPMEQEILDLERQLAQKKAEREKALEPAVGLEEPKAVPALSSSPAPPVVIAPPSDQVQADAQSLKGVEKNQQLKGLVDLAFQKGVAHATQVARNLDNPYLMDEFHDTMIDEFHKKLVEEGKLEEI